MSEPEPDDNGFSEGFRHTGSGKARAAMCPCGRWASYKVWRELKVEKCASCAVADEEANQDRADVAAVLASRADPEQSETVPFKQVCDELGLNDED